MLRPPRCFLFFFFNDTATTEIYTLSLHDALPIFIAWRRGVGVHPGARGQGRCKTSCPHRSEEHTSELQSPCNLVCRLLLEKKKIKLYICPSTEVNAPPRLISLETHNDTLTTATEV